MAGRVAVFYHLFGHVFYGLTGHFRGFYIGLTDVEVVYLSPFQLGLLGIGDKLPDGRSRHQFSFGRNAWHNNLFL